MVRKGQFIRQGNYTHNMNYKERDRKIRNAFIDLPKLKEALGITDEGWEELRFTKAESVALSVLLTSFTLSEIAGIRPQLMTTFRGCGQAWIVKLEKAGIWQFPNDCFPTSYEGKLRAKRKERVTYLESRIAKDRLEIIDIKAKLCLS